MKRRIVTASTSIALVVGIGTSGCTAEFKETHLLKTVDDNGKVINYFRVRVFGRSIAAQTRYVSGFYDPRAVENYFGTFSQPADGQFPSTTPASGASHVQQLNGDTDGRLVLLLSSNSDAVADALQALSENEQIASLGVKLANKDRFQEAQASAVNAAIQQGKGETISAVSTESVGALTEQSSAEQATTAMLQLANELAGALGHDRVLLSLDDVKKYAAEMRAKGVVK